MIEFRIWLPPINLWSKPWQHEFDKARRKKNMKYDHTALKQYWLSHGKPPIYFKFMDDPWLPAPGEPTFNPAFEYRLGEADQALFRAYQLENREPDQDSGESYEYKRGYKQALDDMKAHADKLVTARRCQLKGNT